MTGAVFQRFALVQDSAALGRLPPAAAVDRIHIDGCERGEDEGRADHAGGLPSLARRRRNLATRSYQAT